MSDGANDPLSNPEGNVLTEAGDAVGDLVTGIPAPVRKNVFKAIGQLLTAAVDIPVSYMEGVAVQKRAETEARVKFIGVSASQIAARLKIDPAYVEAASHKFAEKVVRERVNIDAVVNEAIEDLKTNPETISATSKEPEPAPISEDWLNAFEGDAAQMNSEQMRRLFGKILAGEIRKPGSFSIRTVKLMAQVDNRAARLFRQLCSLSVSLRMPGGGIIDARVVSMGNAGSNSLAPYGLSFDSLNILSEHGLIITDYNSYMDYRIAVISDKKVGLPFAYQGASWGLEPKQANEPSAELRVHGVAFTQAGRELLSIVDVDQNEQYTLALKAFWENQGKTMVRLGNVLA